jgi:hypothetical protein
MRPSPRGDRPPDHLEQHERVAVRLARAAGSVPPRARAGGTRVKCVRCVWSFRNRSPAKCWHFPSKLSKDGAENFKRIVGLGGRPGRSAAAPAAPGRARSLPAAASPPWPPEAPPSSAGRAGGRGLGRAPAAAAEARAPSLEVNCQVLAPILGA